MRVKENVNRDGSPFVSKKPAAPNGQSHFRPAIRENTNDVLPRRSSKAAACFRREDRSQCNCNCNGALPSTCGIYIAHIFVGKLTRLVVVVVALVVGGSHTYSGKTKRLVLAAVAITRNEEPCAAPVEPYM